MRKVFPNKVVSRERFERQGDISVMGSLWKNIPSRRTISETKKEHGS